MDDKFVRFVSTVSPDLADRLVTSSQTIEDGFRLDELYTKFLQNEEEEKFGFNFDRNQKTIDDYLDVERKEDILKKADGSLDKDHPFYKYQQRLLRDSDVDADMPGYDTLDFGAAAYEDPELVTRALGDVSKTIVDFGSGLAAVGPRTIGFDKTEDGRNKTAKVLSSLFNLNKDNDAGYGMTLLDSIIGEEGLISPPKSVEAATGFINDKLQETIGVTDAELETMPENIKRGLGNVELAGVLASGNLFTQVAKLPYAAATTIAAKAGSRLSIGPFRKEMAERLKYLRDNGATQKELDTLFLNYNKGIRQAGKDGGLDARMVEEIVKLENKRFKTDPEKFIKDFLIEPEIKLINEFKKTANTSAANQATKVKGGKTNNAVKEILESGIINTLDIQKALAAQGITRGSNAINKIKKQLGFGTSNITIEQTIGSLVDTNLSYKDNLINIQEKINANPNKFLNRKTGKPYNVKAERVYQTIKEKFIENKQLSVDEYEKIFLKLINSNGLMKLPDNFTAGLDPKNISRHLKNKNQALENLGLNQKSIASVMAQNSEFKKAEYDLEMFYANRQDKNRQMRNNRTTDTRKENLNKFSRPQSEGEKLTSKLINGRWKTQTSNKLEDSVELQNNILNNDSIISDLSTAIYKDKTGKFTFKPGNPEKAEATKKALQISDFKSGNNSTKYFEEEHIMSAKYAKYANVNDLANIQIIPRKLNTTFKKPADEFIETLLKKTKISDQEKSLLKLIIAEADRLGITLYIPDPEKLGIGIKKYVGYPRTNLKIQAKDIINRYAPGVDLPDLGFAEEGQVRKDFALGDRVTVDTEPLQFDNSPIEIEDEDNFNSAQKMYIGQLTASLERERQQAIVDRIENAPKSMQTALLTTLFDDESTQALEDFRDATIDERNQIKLSMEDVRRNVAEKLTPKLPVRYPLRSIPKFLNENIFFKKFKQQLNTGPLILGSIANDIQNKMSPDDPKTFEERYPVLAKNLITPFAPTEGTKDEDAYVDGILEVNRAIETGFSNLGYNTMDLVLSGIDLASFGGTDLTTKLRDLHDNRNINEPETFFGDLVAILTEYGIPGGLIAKVANRAQKAMRLKGFNTLPRYVTDDLSKGFLGASQLRQISNVSKRMGTGAVVFGLTDAFSGGPYSSLKRMLPEDATLLPGKQEDTSSLTGKELIAANFRNRIRFGADGAAVGFLFPLLGPPIFSLIKGTAKLPFKGFLPGGYSVAGAGAKVIGGTFTGAADLLAGKIPFTNKLLPYNFDKIGVPGQVASKIIQASTAFVGKQVATRALLGLGDVGRATKNLFNFAREDIITKAGKAKYSSTTFNRSLPDFQTWRDYTVNNTDPLHKALASIDNKLAVFRDIGKLTKNAFALSSEADLGIKAGSRIITKYLKQVENTAYDMAKQFEERAQRYGEYETFQKKYLDDVLDYISGKIKKNQLPPKIRDSAENLKAYTTEIKKDFKELLPKEDELFKLLNQNIDKYMRSSFKVFTNADYNPDPKAAQKALQYIEELLKTNPATKDQAKRFFPDLPLSKAIEEMAELKLADILKVARYESEDPLAALTKISKRLDPDTDLKLLTGEELPKVMRTYLGEEKDLRSSLLQTTGNILASTYQKTALDRIAVMGLENGWLFVDDIAAKNIGKMTNPSQLVDVKGSGFLPSDIIGTWGTPELVKQLSGYSIFDSLLKFKLYQNLIAFKAMVQGGKTLYSPATQMRNFGSAAFFALNSGHIGGSVGVAQGFKLVLDDIFGAGSKVEQEQMIKVLERKLKLGVLDENVQANELGAILRDLKNVPGQVTEGGAVISNFNQLTQKIGEGNISQTVQRLYAGGDNVWKFYGHEFYMSNLQGVIRTMDDVKGYYKNIMGRDFDPVSFLSGKQKTVAEGIEEIAAYLVRETYPTYSRVPPVVQALRKLPLGNFISFPAEIIRTSAQTTSLALKHIASDNAGLRALGYRSLIGQFTTMYGFNQGVSALASHATGINQETLQAYTKRLGPEFMQDHTLMPITAQDENGAFKAFNLSTYHPYDYLIAPVQAFLAEGGRTKLDPDQIEGEVYNRYMNAFRPFFKSMQPFVSETIALEPFIDIWLRGGKASNGKIIFVSGPGGDDFGTKIEKSFNHAVETLSPGFVRSTDQVLGALKADIKGGKIMDLSDTIVKLLGGSIIDINPKQALNYKARDIRDIRTNAFRGEIFFSKEQARGRNLPAEYEDIIKSSLQGQFEMYMLFKDAMDTGLLTQEQIEEVLGPDGRNVPLLDNLIEGIFTPPSYAPKVLESRANELVNEYEKMGLYYDTYDFYPEYDLDEVFDKYEDKPFSDFIDKTNEKEGNQYDYTSPSITVPGEIPDFEIPELEIPDIPELEVPDIPNIEIPDISQTPLPESKPVDVAAAQPAAGVVNQATGLTSTESALLDRDEQLIRQRQRGTV